MKCIACEKAVILMQQKMTRREFIKTAAVSALAFSALGILSSDKVFAASDCSVK